MKIKSIHPRKIINSAAAWTIETKIVFDDSSIGIASVPGGISKGLTEVVSLPAEQAVEIINDISDELINREFDTQKDFDDYLKKLDGTKDKSKLGGNSMLSLSAAFLKASAKSKNLETYQYISTLINPEIEPDMMNFKMPKMMMLILEGGLHGSGDASIQEFMAIVDDVNRGIEIYKNVKDDLHKNSQSTNVGAEGAFSPDGYNNEHVLDLLTKHLRSEKIALDVAASSISDMDKMPDYENILEKYPIELVEDPYGETEWNKWITFAAKYKDRFTIVTDDLTTTNPEILRRAISDQVGNAILVKPNQIGTISETLEVIDTAHKANWKTIISHRGTDTNDDLIADIAVGAQSEFTKFGAPARGERVAKYNRLLEIFNANN